MNDLSGQSFGRYHLIEQLGEGGMATVYKAYDTRLDREVAVKVIRRSAFSPEILDRVLKRFDREAKSLARLTHPNIVSIIDYGEYENSPYLVMSYLPGGTVKQFLGKPMACEKAIELLLPIADALRYSHQKGIVHRDVKPANILITEGGQPMLTDFGIARLLENEDAQTLTGTGVGVGTPEYMSPEQGIGKEVDGRSDIYSLGVVLYELVTGHKPYTADTPMAIVLKQATEPLPNPRKFVPELPEKIERVLFKALAKKPEDRFQSMGDFARAMSEAISKASQSVVEVDNFSLIPSGRETPAGADETGEATFDLGVGSKAAALSTKPVVVPASLSAPFTPGKPVEEKYPVSTNAGQNPGDSSHSEGSRSSRKKRLSAQPRPVRKPWLKWALAAIGVVIIGAIVWGIFSSMAPFGVPASATAETSPTQTLTLLPDVIPAQTLTPLPEVAPTQTPASAFTIDSHGNSVMRLGNGTLNQITFSPDEKYLATASSVGIFLYDADSLSLVRFLNTEKWVYSMAFSPDGQLLASGSENAVIHLWNVNNGELLQTIDSHPGAVRTISFLQDGRRLVSISGTLIEVWDVESGTQLDSWEVSSWEENATFSPDGRFLATTNGFDILRVWNIEGGYLEHKWKNYSYNSIAFSPNGYWIAYGGYGGLHLIDADCGLEKYSTYSDGFNITFSSDGEKLASTDLDGVITVLDAYSGEISQTIESHSSVIGLAFSPNGMRIAIGTEDGTIQLWDIESDVLLDTLEGYTYRDNIMSITFSPDGRSLASGSDDGTISMWDAQSGTVLQTLEGRNWGVSSVAFSPDGRSLASGFYDGTIMLWDMESGMPLQALEGHNNGVWSVAFSPDGRKLASGSIDATIKMWNAASGVLLQTLEGHNDMVESVAFSPDGRRLASGSYDGTIRLWDAESGALINTLAGHRSAVLSVAFSPDGRRLASGSQDDTIRLWDTESGALLQTLEGHSDDVNSVAFSPDGRRLASGSSDDTIKLWDAESGALLQTLEGHTSDVNSVAFSPDGKKLASGSSDGTIRIWNIAKK